VRGQTAVASVVFVVTRAVDQLLLGVGLQVSVLDEMAGFKAARGGKGPAGSAVALVLDRANSTKCTPVPLNWDLVGNIVARLGCAALLVTLKIVVGLSFRGRHGGVLVDTTGERLLWLFVVTHDQYHVIPEDFESFLPVLA
jgi:hypothetical protein